MAKHRRRADERPESGTRIILEGRVMYVAHRDAIWAARLIKAQLILGNSREDAEKYALEKLQEREQALRYFKGK